MARSRIPSFKDLEVWKKSMDLISRVYEITKSYPREEQFGLVAESRKSARSVPSNISEGKMRTSPTEFRRFIAIALGSSGELQTQVLIARRLRYIAVAVSDSVEGDIEEVCRMLRGLERALS